MRRFALWRSVPAGDYRDRHRPCLASARLSGGSDDLIIMAFYMLCSGLTMAAGAKWAAKGLQNRRCEIQSRTSGPRWSRANVIWETSGQESRRRPADGCISDEKSDMTTVTTFDPTKPLTDLDIVTAFARKTAQTGEEPRVRNLWDTRYRINYYLHNDNRIGRSLFVALSCGKIEISKVQ